jgi:hypothetical protein
MRDEQRGKILRREAMRGKSLMVFALRRGKQSLREAVEAGKVTDFDRGLALGLDDLREIKMFMERQGRQEEIKSGGSRDSNYQRSLLFLTAPICGHPPAGSC